MKCRVLICACIMGILLTACGSNENNTEYEELLEEYETLEQEHKDLKRQYEQLLAENEMMRLMQNAQASGNREEIFEDIFKEDKEPETIPGVEFLPVYKNASISLSDQAKELLQTSYDDIEAIDEYSDTVYDVGTIFGNREWYTVLDNYGKFKYGITNVIIGEEAIRLQLNAKKLINFDTTNETLVALEICIALDNEYTIDSSGKYRFLSAEVYASNKNGDNSSKKTSSFTEETFDIDKSLVINKPVAGKVCVVYQFFIMPEETKEFTLDTRYDYMHVNVDDWK